MKKLWMILYLLVWFPISVFAYSNEIMIGGQTIGIEVHAEGVYVVAFYPVNGKEIAKKAGFQKGDRIISVNQKEVHSINDLNRVLEKPITYTFLVKRNQKEKVIYLPVEEEENLLKTGLYVKDQINGIGTLSYLDPETHIYGSLGHEILENSAGLPFALRNGTIYKAEVSSIQKSQSGQAGSKNGQFRREEVYGDVLLNEEVGIFGTYHSNYSGSLIAVGKKEEIHTGEAIIRTVIEKEKQEDFMIKILAIDESSLNKNILFEITDQKLLQKTGGIIQGMSGSPIIQDHKIIGVVNYVIVDEPKKGYGIFITTMLEKGDELVS